MPQVQFLPAQYVDSSLVVEALACEAEDASAILVCHPIRTGGGMVNSFPCHGKDCGFESRPVRQIKIFQCGVTVARLPVKEFEQVRNLSLEP